MRTISMKATAEIMCAAFPDHRPLTEYRAAVRDHFFKHAIWLGASVRVTELEDRSRLRDEDILGILTDGPLGAAKRAVVINAIGTEARPPRAPPVRGAFLMEGEGFEAFLEHYRREIWPTLFEGNNVILVAPDVGAAGILHDGWVVLRIGKPDFLCAIRRRRPGISIEIMQPPSEPGSEWCAVVEDNDFIIEARSTDENELVRQVSSRMASSHGQDGKVVVAYLDTAMTSDVIQAIERLGAIAVDRRSMDVLLDLVVPIHDRISKWDVDSYERLKKTDTSQ